MRILLAAVASSSRPDGVGRHAANVARCLLLHEEVTQVHLVVGPWQREAMLALLGDFDSRLQLTVAKVGPSALARNAWYWFRLPKLALRLGSDILHAAYPVSIRTSALACPAVVSLHDLYPYDIPENFGFPKVLANRFILQHCLHAADVLACVSDTTLHRLQLYANDAVVRKAATIYNCVNVEPQISTVSPIPRWHGERFVLCVAQHRRNKNLPLAIEVFQRLRIDGDVPNDARLVIVGSDGPETARLKRLIQSAGLIDNVTLLRGISDAELRWCYTRCELLLATSTIEGFGLPIVEAMLNHCRVVCSDIPAYREVGGSYCEYAVLGIDALETFLSATRVALKSHRFRAMHTDQFSAKRVGDSYIQLYGRLIEASGIRKTAPRRGQTPVFERGQP